MDKEKIIALGSNANLLLKDETFQMVMSTLKIEAFSAFVNSNPDESGLREQNYYKYKAILDIESQLNNFVDCGLLEQRTKEEDVV